MLEGPYTRQLIAEVACVKFRQPSRRSDFLKRPSSRRTPFPVLVHIIEFLAQGEKLRLELSKGQVDVSS